MSEEQTLEAVFRVLRNWRLSTMAQEDSPSEGYPLVDAVSTPGTDISTGEEELHELAFTIVAALPPSRATEVTEAMIEAGLEAWSGHKSAEEIVTAIYLAMSAARAVEGKGE